MGDKDIKPAMRHKTKLNIKSFLTKKKSTIEDNKWSNDSRDCYIL